MIPAAFLLKLRALPWRWIGVLALLVVTFATGFKVANWRRDSLELAVVEAAEKASAAATKAAVDAIADIEVQNVTIRQRAETVVREVPVYRDARHTPDGLSVVNQALTPPEQRSDPAGVPAAGSAD